MQAALRADPHEKHLQTMPIVLRVNLADTHFLLGDYARAAGEVERLLPSCKTPADYLCAARLWFGCLPCVEADPRLSAPERRALAEDYFGRAKKAAQTATEQSGGNPEIRHSVARTMLFSCGTRPGVLAEVGATARQLVTQFPNVGIAWNTLGITYYRAGEPAAAIPALEKSAQLRSGGDGHDFFFLAMAHWRVGDKGAARKWYERGVRWIGNDWVREDEFRALRAEAAGLVGMGATPPAKGGTAPATRQ
jgi:tetratricopeptide (TPR) repeat protein